MDEELKKYIKEFLTKIYNVFNIVYNDDISKMDSKELDEKIKSRLKERTSFLSKYINVPENIEEFENAAKQIKELYEYYSLIRDEKSRKILMNNIVSRFNEEERLKKENLEEKFVTAFNNWCENNPVDKVINSKENRDSYVFQRTTLDPKITYGTKFTKEIVELEKLTKQRGTRNIRLIDGIDFARYLVRRPSSDNPDKIDEIGLGKYTDQNSVKIFAQIDNAKMMSDKEYRKFVLNELFSDEAIQLADIYTGGYIGAPVFNQKTGKYERHLAPEVVQAVRDYIKDVKGQDR